MKKTVFLSILLSFSHGFLYAGDFDYKRVYKERSPAVVIVTAIKSNGKGASGTGSIIHEDGLVLTNAHVVIDEKTGRAYPYLYVYPKPENFNAGSRRAYPKRRFKTSLVKYSENMDLALLKIESTPGKFPVIPLADSFTVETGDPVLAIGHPEQGGWWTLTTGVISAKIKDFEDIKGKDVFQTETSLNRGNSGGPLLNLQGAMVGVNSNIARRGKGDLAITGINFSITSGVARRWLKDAGYSLAYSLPLEGPESKKENVDLKLGPYPVIPKGPGEKPEPELSSEEKRKLWADGTQLTPKHPYMPERLYKVEEEMHGLMERMRKKYK